MSSKGMRKMKLLEKARPESVWKRASRVGIRRGLPAMFHLLVSWFREDTKGTSEEKVRQALATGIRQDGSSSLERKGKADRWSDEGDFYTASAEKA